MLLPHTQCQEDLGAEPSPEFRGLAVDNQHGFLNVSVTPIECSVVCHSAWTKNVFEPFIRGLPKDSAKSITISRDTYLILSVISAGMDAASRVMELTSPLALAGIPIFFITTYYSDFILVPSKARWNVTQALLARGFELAENQTSFVNQSSYPHAKGPSRSNTPPVTPPPSTVAELQTRTFDLLKKRNVLPVIDPDLRLVQCAGKETSQWSSEIPQRPSLSRQVTGNGYRHSWLDSIDTKLYTGMVSALVSQPRFISITLAQDDPPSLLLDKSLLGIFGDSVVGDIEGEWVPIFLDLANLPFEATGIVCGVAGKLVADMNMVQSSELSYLSTARAGAVILSNEQSVRALGILKLILEKGG